MKLLKLLSIVAGCFFFTQAATAQSSPAISAEYSNEAIASLIRKYKMSHSHDVIPPAELAAKFKADFPRAYKVEWEVADGIYEVEFDIKFRDYTAYYDAKGNLLMTEEEIYRSELPAIVKNAAETKYPKYSFEDIDRIRRGTEVFYEIEMELRDAEVKLLIKSDGTVLEERID
ncbi:MAG: PepSY-like domain-containing protein [Prevotellaceae bacterium]|nr:PepSY-like domain-containing protein [Prevotellaceae bacterium]